MKNRWTIVGIVVALALAVGIYIWQHHKDQEIDPRTLADQIATGKSFPILGKDAVVRSNSPAADYFALPPGPKRDAFLDEMIDMQEKTRQQIASGEIKLPAGFSPPPPGGKPAAEGDAAANEKQHTSIHEEKSPDGSRTSVTVRLNAEDLSPTLRAQMQEFAAALQKRRKERGLDPNAPMMIIRNEVRTEKK